MNRIQKIVARGKSEFIKEHGPILTKPPADEVICNPRTTRFNYTTTRVEPVSEPVLKARRVIAQDSTDPDSNRFQLLRAKILQQMRRRNWSTLGITAPAQGAGKSLVAANLAISMAQEGNQSVLLVDMDLRRPGLHEYFGLEPTLGIQDFLDGSCRFEETLVNPGINGLVILPGRQAILNSSEQLAAPSVKRLVEELKHFYKSRIIIFDIPPTLTSDDAMVFLPYVDCSLLVIEAGASTRTDLEQSLAIIGSNPLLGTVLNKTAPISKGGLFR